MMRSLTTKEILAAVTFAAIVFSVVPMIVGAQTNIDATANAQCIPVYGPQCPCQPKLSMKNGKLGCFGPDINKMGCPCKGTKTSGTCVANNDCKATSFISESGQKGGAPGMDQLMSALKGLMDALKGGGGGSPPPMPPMGGMGGVGGSGSFPQGCTTYYQTSVQGNTDPCSYYVPDYSQQNQASTTFNTDRDVAAGCTSYTETTNPNDNNPCTFYVPAIPTGTFTPDEDGDCTVFTRTSNPADKRPCTFYVGPGTSTGAIPKTNQASPPSFFTGFLHGIVGMKGERGDLREDGETGTAFGGVNDWQNNTGYGVFMGSRGTMGDGSISVVGRLCITRPWANRFVSFLIKPSFFDNLCTSRGYQLGAPEATRDIVPTGTAVKKVESAPPPAPPARNYIPPQVDIWAVPAAVSIGARTSVFWNSRGVVECLVTSPDGNFSETSLSGGASTVPIVAPVEFTIVCKAPDGTEVKNSVLVTLKI